MIELPWPSKDLSPNARIHYMKLAKEKAKAKEVAFYICKQHGLKILGEGNIPLSIIFHPPTRARFDLDGLLSRCKAYLDGVSTAAGIDDVRFRPITIDFGDPVKDGKIILKIALPPELIRVYMGVTNGEKNDN